MSDAADADGAPAPREAAPEAVQLTPSEWHAALESRSFLEEDGNRFQPPRRLAGAPVEIVPDDSFKQEGDTPLHPA